MRPFAAARVVRRGGRLILADVLSPADEAQDRWINEVEVLRDPFFGEAVARDTPPALVPAQARAVASTHSSAAMPWTGNCSTSGSNAA